MPSLVGIAGQVLADKGHYCLSVLRAFDQLWFAHSVNAIAAGTWDKSG
jgi:hypothetical protein